MIISGGRGRLTKTYRLILLSQVNAICHHLSHTVWQEQTEGLVRGLTASSLATFDRAEQSLEKQELVRVTAVSTHDVLYFSRAKRSVA